MTPKFTCDICANEAVAKNHNDVLCDISKSWIY